MNDAVRHTVAVTEFTCFHHIVAADGRTIRVIIGVAAGRTTTIGAHAIDNGRDAAHRIARHVRTGE